MSTLRSTLARFAFPFIGLFLILFGLTFGTALVISPVVIGGLAIAAGLCALCAS
jgi:hypothetical protein